MTYLVPYDDSPLARAALARADALADAFDRTDPTFDRDVLVFTVVPDNERRVRDRGWLDEDREFSLEAVEKTLRERVRGLVSAASFEMEVVDPYAPRGRFATEIRRKAHDSGTDLVFIGSENAGRVMTPVSSVGGGVSAETDYDVFLVRQE